MSCNEKGCPFKDKITNKDWRLMELRNKTKLAWKLFKIANYKMRSFIDEDIFVSCFLGIIFEVFTICAISLQLTVPMPFLMFIFFVLFTQSVSSCAIGIGITLFMSRKRLKELFKAYNVKPEDNQE